MKLDVGEKKQDPAGVVLCPSCRLLAIMTVLLLAIWSLLFSHFVPTRLGEEISLGGAVALGAAGAAFGAWGGFFRPELNPNYSRMMARTPMLERVPNRVMTLALLGFVFGFLGVQGALLEWWTVTTGRPGQMLVHVSNYQGAARHGCTGLDFQEAPWLLRRGVCVRYPSTDDAPRRGAPVMLQGMASLTGIEVSSYQVLASTVP